MTTFELFDMGARTEVTSGTSVTIADRLGSVSGTPPLIRWSYKQSTSDVVTVTIDGVTETFTLPAQPAAGVLAVGAQVYPTNPTTNAHINITPVLNAMPASLDFVRVGIPWRLLQPTSSAWDETEAGYLDTVFADLNSRGLDVLLTVGTTPTWALASGSDTLMPPANPANFGAWVDAVIDRWGSVINIVGIDPWNEPNLDSFYHGTDAEFVQLVQAAHSAAVGRVPIASGSLSLADYEYFAGLFDVGLTVDDFDFIDVHPYPMAFTGLTHHWVNPHRPPTVEADFKGSLIAGVHELERVITAQGGSEKPVWISEWGASSNPVDPANPSQRMTDSRAADWLTTAVDQASRMSNIHGLCIHEAIDLTGSGNSWNEGWGLLRPDYTRRAKWAALNSA